MSCASTVTSSGLITCPKIPPTEKHPSKNAPAFLDDFKILALTKGLNLFLILATKTRLGVPICTAAIPRAGGSVWTADTSCKVRISSASFLSKATTSSDFCLIFSSLIVTNGLIIGFRVPPQLESPVELLQELGRQALAPPLCFLASNRKPQFLKLYYILRFCRQTPACKGQE